MFYMFSDLSQYVTFNVSLLTLLPLYFDLARTRFGHRLKK